MEGMTAESGRIAANAFPGSGRGEAGSATEGDTLGDLVPIGESEGAGGAGQWPAVNQEGNFLA